MGFGKAFKGFGKWGSKNTDKEVDAKRTAEVEDTLEDQLFKQTQDTSERLIALEKQIETWKMFSDTQYPVLQNKIASLESDAKALRANADSTNKNVQEKSSLQEQQLQQLSDAQEKMRSGIFDDKEQTEGALQVIRDTITTNREEQSQIQAKNEEKQLQTEQNLQGLRDQFTGFQEKYGQEQAKNAVERTETETRCVDCASV